MIVGAFLIAIAANSADAADGVAYGVMLSNIPLAQAERVVGIDLTITAAAVASVANLPAGWRIDIDNDPSRVTHIRASAAIGSAALGADRLRDISIVITKK